MSKDSIVVIGDIIKSKKINNRKSVQNKLTELLTKLNDEYQKDIESPFKITLGDEFYGVLNNFSPVIDILQFLEIEFKEIDFRFGIGQGEYNDNSQGTGYENALKAIKYVKDNKFSVHLISDKANNNFQMINLILHLYFSIFNKFTFNQKYIIYNLSKGKKQKEIAADLNSSQSSVSQSLTNINWKLLVRSVDFFKELTGKRKKIEINLKGEHLALIGAYPRKLNEGNKIENTLTKLNEEYNNLIRSKFVLTTLSEEAKDYFEFQALFKKEISDYQKLLYLFVDLYYEINELYVGLGSGDISTEIKDQALGMDGPAFYKAREALKKSFTEGMSLNLIANENLADTSISIILSLLLEFVKKWTSQQKKAVNYRIIGLSQNEIKEKMGLSARSTIGGHLQRAGWKEYEYIVKKLSELLAENTTLMKY
ncbi:SatD family protein [Halanaerobium saccharolyticum]|uniref:SatD family protein n=1 Tax=Halanaerobium saccharolyticum TaxID=43595 RepID=A0A4V3G3V3_9FIRM|nr:SatD family protein [Halanaerobium saccharolyticum]RAK04162.1 SatD family protein [Halanaerobium saccharolyticum]TDV97957.1 SatD family protein [Halanaerobium saccharolyticum]TDX51018.1 SatD family protein [Halanaerobium saccharolyticum]